MAIPLRICLKKNIPGYICSYTATDYFDFKRIYRYDYNAFNQYYDNLSKFKKKKILGLTKSLLKKKFDYKNKYYSEKSFVQENAKHIDSSLNFLTFGKKTKKFSFNRKKKNVVIFAHCFYDSPNILNHLFNDFYEWLNFLGKISLETDYDWYIKRHPHTINSRLNEIVLNKLVKKFPKIKLLPKDINHFNILNNIDLGLTIYGSVAYEYPYFNKKILIASKSSHFSGFKFCVHAKSVQNYADLIKNIHKIKPRFNKNEIAKFYFSLLNKSDPFNLLRYKDILGQDFYEPKIYDVFLKNFSLSKHKNLLISYEKFVEKKYYRFLKYEGTIKSV
jgi:hypothetical protein